ncbi:MAG: formimidoylglutamate deiminase [Acidobacteria bacterium]|nr:formimidoylglutamate deiminase [Acidobacteriota bacterium]
MTDGTTTFIPDLLYVGGRFERARALACDAEGRVVSVVQVEELKDEMRAVRLRGRAMLPGLVNAHSHAFQRVIRGRTEYRGASPSDSFWTWREMMYAAAARLTPEDIYDASRMAFLEMLLSGITSVGEFHYLHRTPAGGEYDEPNLLALEVVRAARDVGLRIALLRVAYARAGFQKEPDPRQQRFIESDPDTFIRNAQSLARAFGDSGHAWLGVAPHSVRAVPLEYLRAVSDYARARELPLHMHVAEQPAEVEACVAETGRTPVSLLADEGVLSPRFTGVHAVHVTPEEVRLLAESGACVCACPTTERNLGDGVVPADLLLDAGVRVALGTDSHTQIDLLEDARELEYHLRLRTLRRNVLDESRGGENGEGRGMSALAARLFECATRQGAESIGAHAGEFEPGRAADFFTVDLEDPTVAGASDEDLLPAIVFSLTRAAVRETAVGGRLLVEAGRHPAQDDIVSRFRALQRRLWGSDK